jgi:cystathionine beta-lyase
MATAAYSADGAAWVDALMDYLDGNRKLFDATIAAIPGLRSMPLEATYLSWVDFAATGMTMDEALGRVEKTARICVNHGPTFGRGGETHLRFNLATPRPVLEQAMERLTAAFADLQ